MRNSYGEEIFGAAVFCVERGRNVSEQAIKEYVKNQGKQDSYEQILLKL